MEALEAKAESVEVWYSLRRMAILISLCVAMMFFCLLNLIYDPPTSELYYFLLLVGVVFLGSLAIRLLWNLVSNKTPVLTFSKEGLLDKRIARGVIPWSSITAVKNWSSGSAKLMIVSVDKETEKSLDIKFWPRISRPLNALLGADGLYVSDGGLSLKHHEILAITSEYLADYGQESFRKMP